MASSLITISPLKPFIFLLFVAAGAFTGITAAGQLRVGFYSETCPSAESIIHNAVKAAVNIDPRNAAIVLRVHFHDCFVEGCDASIMVENGPSSENKAFGHQGVGGFDILEGAKAEIERVCPGVVSCADIIALAARDAIVLSDGPYYEVPTGRRDGRVSDMALAADMPDVDDSIEKLRAKFHQKGLSDKDLVLLNVAHTIGTTACFFMNKRLYHFTPSGGSDPAINPRFLPFLNDQCPEGGDVETRLPLDPVTAFTFDAQILRNIQNGFAVIASDARLYDDESTRGVVDSYIKNKTRMALSGSESPFKSDFVASMIKMGRIEVKTGSEGEIRKVCSSFN